MSVHGCPFTAPSGYPVEKRVEAAGGALVPSVTLPAAAWGELREVAGVKHVRLDVGAFRPVRGVGPVVDVDAPSVGGPIQDIACINAEIFIVAKLENVSDTAYGKMI